MFARFALYTIATIAFLAFMRGIHWLVYSNSRDFSFGLMVGGGGMLAIVCLYEWFTGLQLGDQQPGQKEAENLRLEKQSDLSRFPPNS